MALFATSVWGFDPVRWPTIQFSREAYRDRLLRDSDDPVPRDDGDHIQSAR